MTQNPARFGVPPHLAPSSSLIAARVGRMTLRMGHYPGRTLVGTFLRKQSRKRGGQSFYARANDGTRLAAWFSPADTPPQAGPVPQAQASDQPANFPTSTSATPSAPAAKLPIILSHGWCETKEFHFRHAWRLNQRGHDVILFDHRSHGRSGGRFVTFGVRERHDLTAVADQAVRQGFITDRFITFGFSLGAATVLQHAPNDDRVAGVVAFAPFLNFRQAILSFRDCLAPWVRNDAWLLRGFETATRQHGFALDDACTLNAIRRLDAPVLLVEAGRDVNLPPHSHTRKLLPAKTRGDIHVITIPQATHRTLCRRPWPGLSDQVATFCASLH